MTKAQICFSFIILLYISSVGNFMRVNAQAPVVSKGGTCYDPINLYNSASVAMNLYYQNQGRHYSKCDFEGSGIITVTDPSCGCCIYEFYK
ncbi:hypothetical protein ARALYDRAFT_333379 [Arabidopsis lyrata subsp. lyrata]|uniref:X8 domain-containing protein n=1 Tax=Arabidopsis lyrata subsp. lyrata TaxID=81972 RepID=D7MXY7_ARALL|nr:hypothetical protein ARALYDRAFT_333379 [Arabidopsis lyrata subsp. lyrata]